MPKSYAQRKMSMNKNTSLSITNSEIARPLYQQIKDAISENIRNGVWPPGTKLPSENQLASDLGASRMTINRPLRELTAEGHLKRIQGVGTFVTEPARHANLIELKPIAEEIQSQGKQHRAKVLTLKSIKSKRVLAERMGINTGDPLFHIIVVHYQDDIPIQYETRHVNPSVVPNFMQIDFTKTTPGEFLVSQVRPEELEHIVQAILPTTKIAKHLSINTVEPCLRLKRRTWKDGQIVTAADLIYPSSRYDLGARYQPLT